MQYADVSTIYMSNMDVTALQNTLIVSLGKNNSKPPGYRLSLSVSVLCGGVPVP